MNPNSTPDLSPQTVQNPKGWPGNSLREDDGRPRERGAPLRRGAAFALLRTGPHLHILHLVRPFTTSESRRVPPQNSRGGQGLCLAAEGREGRSGGVRGAWGAPRRRRGGGGARRHPTRGGRPSPARGGRGPAGGGRAGAGGCWHGSALRGPGREWRWMRRLTRGQGRWSPLLGKPRPGGSARAL